jgi:hypothetical protein
MLLTPKRLKFTCQRITARKKVASTPTRVPKSSRARRKTMGSATKPPMVLTVQSDYARP